jgi:hypothetical protein
MPNAVVKIKPEPSPLGRVRLAVNGSSSRAGLTAIACVLCRLLPALIVAGVIGGAGCLAVRGAPAGDRWTARAAYGGVFVAASLAWDGSSTVIAPSRSASRLSSDTIQQPRDGGEGTVDLCPLDALPPHDAIDSIATCSVAS